MLAAKPDYLSQSPGAPVVELLWVVPLTSTRHGTLIPLTCKLILNKQKYLHPLIPGLVASPKSVRLRLIRQECLSGCWNHSILSVAAQLAVMD